jgi:hypothetical protein
MKNNLNYFYNSKLLISTLVLLIIVGILLFIVNLFQSNSKFKMKFYAKGHIDKLSGQFNIENFTDSKQWFVKIPNDSMSCPSGTNSSTRGENETCCSSHESTSSKYKSLNPDYDKYIVDSCGNSSTAAGTDSSAAAGTDSCSKDPPGWTVTVPNGVTMDCPPGTERIEDNIKDKTCVGLPRCSNEYKELSSCYDGYNQLYRLL